MDSAPMCSVAWSGASVRADVGYAVAFFLAEMRSIRRSASYWLVAGVAASVVGLVYGHYSYFHGIITGSLPPVGDLGPRYLLSQIGVLLLWLLLFATVLLASDAPSRDRRERLADALDARPASNLSAAAGRALAVAAAAWAQILAIVLLVQMTGHVAVSFDWWGGAPLEAWSLAAFVLLDAPAALLLFSALAVLLAVVLRSRLAAAAVAVGVLLALSWALLRTPAYLLPAASPVASYGTAITELAPSFADGRQMAQRGALLALAAAALLFAAALHRRRDATHVRGRVVAGVALAAAGATALAVLVWQARDAKQQRAEWLAAHRAVAAVERGIPYLRHVEGDIRIEPGRALHLDLALRLVVPDDGADALAFTLNPGLAVESVALDGAAASFRHEDGLLTVRRDAAIAARQATVAIRTRGVPDADFAYLDSLLDWRSVPPSQLHFLGIEAAVFEPGYVALMPGTFWLPRPGAAVPGSHGNARRFDLHGVDLQVEVPASWLVAGPGCIEAEEKTAVQPLDGSTRRFRVRPSAPVAAVALFASRFERRTGAAGPARVDLLLAPRHAGNLDLFEDAAAVVRGRLGNVLSDAAARGLPYPYECITAVEVPASLRGYGGGWRMPSTVALPGVLPIRERGFPTATYQLALGPALPGMPSDVKAGILYGSLLTDNTGAGPLEWLSSNLLLDQVAVVGRGADAVRYVLHELLMLALGHRFPHTQMTSARLFDQDARPHVSVAHAIGHRLPGLHEARQEWMFESGVPVPDDTAWDRVATVPPAAYADAPTRTSVVALAMRGKAVAGTLFDALGHERTWALLAELRPRHGGIGWEEVEAAAAGRGVDVRSLVGQWLQDPRLPGFLASPATVARVRDDDEGRQRHAVRLHVRNGEPVPGVVRLGTHRYGFGFIGEPVPVPALSAVEISVATPEPPNQLWLYPGLSLNRDPLRVGLAVVADADDAEPFLGVRPSTWRSAKPDGIVVDDLHPGFSIEAADANVRMHRSAVAALWRQGNVPGSWGEYRHTAAMASGEGRTRTVFVTAVETPGRYDLDYHVPDRRLPAARDGWQAGFIFGALGSHEITVQAVGVDAVLNFAGSAAEVGWNKLGSFDLAAGPVRVAVSDRADGATVIADAIRWRPVSVAGGAASARDGTGP